MEDLNVKQSFPCPDCGQQAMELVEDQTLMRCSKCKAEMQLDTYAISLQLAQKELIIEALKMFLEAGTGRCVKFNGKHYIVGFDDDYDIVTEKYELGQNQQEGMYVRLSFQKEEGK